MPDLVLQSHETFTNYDKPIYAGITEHMVRFNEDGDAIGRYTIFQFQKISASEYDYVPIGNWSDMYVLFNGTVFLVGQEYYLQDIFMLIVGKLCSFVERICTYY